MALIRSDRTLEAIRNAYQTGDAAMKLRSYHLPEYQQALIELLAEDSGLSKAGVVRQIIDEWYEAKISERVEGQ